MGKTKHPDEVKPKQFSDSLELFDSLFQEELQSGTQKELPAPSPKAKPPSTYKGGPDQQLEDFPSTKPKKPPDDETKPLLRKPKLPPQAKRSAPPVGAPKPKRSHRAKGDTLEMRRKGTKPTSGPVQTDKKPVLETEVVPQGIIVKGIDQIKKPPPDDVKPETVGKFYTPKESKGIIPTVTIKESNLYKVVLSGFALAIIVMVVINFLGIMGSDETKDVSPTKKAAVQKTPSNKRPPKVANKPKNNKAVETSKKNAQKNSTAWKSSKPVSRPQANKPVKKSKIRPQSVPVKPSVPDSVSPPLTTQPTVAQEKSKDPEQMVTSESFKKHLATILDQQKPGSPESSREPTTTIQETAKAAPVVPKRSEPAVMNQQEIKSSPTSPPSSSGAQETVEKPVAPKLKAYPYSVYLGAYKTLERAKVAVSQYQEKGFSSHWVKVDLGRKGTWFRLFTGHFSDEESAQGFIDLWDLDEAHVKKTRYSTLIGVYSSKDAMESKSEALLKLGYSTYVVDGHNGTSQLYSGAFVTKGGAEKQYQELVTKGIRNRVVER